MGKTTRKRRRRKFNGPSGRHSYVCKKRYAKASREINKSLSLLPTKATTKKPYRIVKKVSVQNGKKVLKFVLKRIDPNNTYRKKLCSVRTPGTAKLTVFSNPLNELEGYRLIDLQSLQDHIQQITSHVAKCEIAKTFTCTSLSGKGPVSLCSERNKCGFSSELISSCVCGEKHIMQTSKTMILDSTPFPEVNIRSVWGTMSTGGGAASLNERASVLNMPGISQSYFSSIEGKIGSLWHSCLEEEMMRAGAEERELAIKQGNFHDGVPSITVVCDGGWSKRSHRHTYNALGGVGVIFGAATGTILHIGIRNKYCSTCTLAETRKTTPAPHTCFKNWTESSQAMESDIIVEGFKKAESVHGVRYLRIIADGDSSVFAKIQESVPVWGRHVQKIECANHVCKCLRSSLEKLVVDKPYYKGTGGLTKRVRVRIVSAVRCAIKMRSKEGNRSKAIKLMNHDIRNSVHHIFGDHSRCTNFCKTRIPTCTSSNSQSTESPSVEELDEITSVLEDQAKYWKEGISEADLEESREALGCEMSLRSDMLKDISILLDRVANKSNRLVGNFTTNMAESWMSVRAKFDGGKVINRCNSGSWNARCYGGALRKNYGPAWSPLVWQKVVGSKPGVHFITNSRQRAIKLLRDLKCKQKPDVKERRFKRKLSSITQSNSKKARKEYGLESVQIVPDIEKSELLQRCEDYVNTCINLSDMQCKKIEELTRTQSLSVTWKEERRKRLTSSVFGEIVRRNPKLTIKKIVKRLLYGNFVGTPYTRTGLLSESISLKEYIEFKRKEQQEVKIEKSGLVIDLKNKHLAASPDGIVVLKNGEKGLVEVKNLLQKNQLSFHDASKKIKGFCLKMEKGKLKLNKDHNYFYQIQGQMNILNLPWVDLVIRRTNPYEFYIERVFKDEDVFNLYMLPKLNAFYRTSILPELAVPREHTSTGIRDPDLPWYEDSICKTRVVETSRKQTRSGSAITKRTDKIQRTTNNSSLSGPSTSGTESHTRVKRRCATKFLGRRILHEWCIDEKTGKTEWYQGRVIGVLKGKDGQPDAVYEVIYDGESDAHEVDNLHEDYTSSSLKFIDV